MYQKILTLGLIYLAAVAEVSLAPNLFLGRLVPDIVLVLVIIWSSRKSFESFWIWAIIAGLVLDAVSLERIGLNAALFLLISFGINFLSKRFFVGQRSRNFFWVAVLILAGTVISYTLGIGLNAAVGEMSLEAFSFRGVIFKAVNNLIILTIIYWPVVSSKNIFPIEESRLVVK